MKRGKIYWCDLDPRRGHEQGAHWPVVIVSANPYNESQSPLIGVVPQTTAVAKNPIDVKLTKDRDRFGDRLDGTGRPRALPGPTRARRTPDPRRSGQVGPQLGPCHGSLVSPRNISFPINTCRFNPTLLGRPAFYPGPVMGADRQIQAERRFQLCNRAEAALVQTMTAHAQTPSSAIFNANPLFPPVLKRI